MEALQIPGLGAADLRTDDRPASIIHLIVVQYTIHYIVTYCTTLYHREVQLLAACCEAFQPHRLAPDTSAAEVLET